jgi:hypothetical protein
MRVRVLHDNHSAARFDLIEVEEVFVFLAELYVLEEEPNVVLGKTGMLIVKFLFGERFLEF